MCLWWWNVFVYNIIVTSITHYLCTAQQSRHFQRSNAAFVHHRTKVWWTIQDILWRTLYSVFVIRVQKWKMTNRLRCKLSALSKHVKLFDKLWISLSEAPFSIEPTAGPLFFMLIQTKRWHFCDKIKLSDSCRWKYEYTQGEKHLVLCATCKPGI